MAHHGGRTIPRAHRPRAPTMSVPVQASTQQLQPHPLTATTTATPRSVSLQVPRPDAERASNEYVETPFRAAAAPPEEKATTTPHQPATLHRLERPARLPLPPHPPRHPTITKQPAPAPVASFTKDCPPGDCTTLSSPGSGAGGNIICSECGRCRCESCRAPRPLPQRWVCDNACLCSADAVIDYASCLCCVKALYYHCSDSDAGATCADEPCSCGPHRRLARWACLGALAAVLPCLLCYWPLRGCQRAVEAAYARHSRAGCRCRPHQATPEKRLLDSSPEF